MSLTENITNLTDNDVAFAVMRGGTCEEVKGSLMPNKICACIQFQGPIISSLTGY